GNQCATTSLDWSNSSVLMCLGSSRWDVLDLGTECYNLVLMATQFKQIREHTVMCTVQACGEVAEFYLRYWDRFRGEPVIGAYCEVHSMAAARRLGCPWPTRERGAA